MVRKKKVQWYVAVTCACGKIHFLGFAPSPAESPSWLSKPQKVRCDVTGNYRVYQPDEIFVTPKGPK
jgi:hypothetical protein